MIYLGANGTQTYSFRFKIGASNLPNNNDLNELEMTQGAKDLGFNLDREHGYLTATFNSYKRNGWKLRGWYLCSITAGYKIS